MKPARFGVVVFPGSCDERDAHGAIDRIEGAQAEYLWHAGGDLGDVDVVVIPGGFSYGDYLRAGAIARFSPVMKAITEFALQGRPVLGICNGFQVLCEAGLLPGALLPNSSLRFVCRQVDVVIENADTPFTRACSPGEVLSVPVKHTTGRYFAPPDALEELGKDGQVLARYAPGANPNGSLDDIAGISNSGKNVFGLMPHPEHAVDPLTGSTGGSRFFQSLVEHCLELA
jgi:phosphoribosylformylglycinamidine synthase subunit PurQ / glutaminase